MINKSSIRGLLAISSLLLAVACSTAPTLSLSDAQERARGAIINCTNVSLTGAQLLPSDRPGNLYRLQCALTATRGAHTLSIPTAVFYFTPNSRGEFLTDARDVNQALTEQYGWKQQGDAMKNDKKRIDSWSIK